ncbi:ATP-dependent DNA helicase PIF1-like protein [Tanacetum coccineum]
MAMNMGSKIESNILGELKEIAVDIGLEIERHNKALNSLDDDVEELIIRVKGANQYKRLSLKIVRKQFPVLVSFTINKSQGQSLSKVGLYLPRPVFTHGQLYIVVSRVTSKKGLKVVVCDKDENISKTTTNVVYKEVIDEWTFAARLINGHDYSLLD